MLQVYYYLYIVYFVPDILHISSHLIQPFCELGVIIFTLSMKKLKNKELNYLA